MKLCGFNVGLDQRFFLIAGPCVIESEQLQMDTAGTLKEITSSLGIPFIFKSSYDKANRSSGSTFRGPGMEKGLEILAKVKRELQVPILTDVHTEADIPAVSAVVDVLQTPAFLCRQTDFIRAVAQSGKPVNIKKGQFLSAEAMRFAVQKVVDSGNNQVMLTERGTMLGYSDMVVDFRSIPVMRSFGYPVVMDITHSVQQPNQSSGVTGGKPELIATIAKAAIATGADGIFLETHPNPSEALSDGANMIPLDRVEDLLRDLIRIRHAVMEKPTA